MEILINDKQYAFSALLWVALLVLMLVISQRVLSAPREDYHGRTVAKITLLANLGEALSFEYQMTQILISDLWRSLLSRVAESMIGMREMSR